MNATDEYTYMQSKSNREIYNDTGKCNCSKCGVSLIGNVSRHTGKRIVQSYRVLTGTLDPLQATGTVPACFACSNDTGIGGREW